MKRWRIALAILMAAAALVPMGAAAQNLLTNGSFETGLTGWTASAFPCEPSTRAAGGTSAGVGAWTAPAPTQGTQVYMGDTIVIGTCTLFQDVTLPPGVSSGVLTYAAGYNYRSFGAPAGCSASVAVTTTANVPIATGYSQVAQAVNDPLAPRAALGFSTTPGGTVRVLITETSCGGGPVGIVADNFALVASAPAAVPTLGDWAKIALAILLAGAALFHLRRNRTA